MNDRSRLLAVGLLVVTALAIVLPLPAAIRLPIVLLGLIGAPSLAAVRFLPRLHPIDVAAIALMFGLATLVIVSESLALINAWSGRLALGAIWLIIATVTYLPSRRSANRAPEEPGSELDLRVLWPDGRVCLTLTIDREGGEIIGGELGRWPSEQQPVGELFPDPDSVIHGETAMSALTSQRRPSRRRGRPTIDVDAVPRLGTEQGIEQLWLVDGDAPPRWWLAGSVRGQDVALGLSAPLEPVVVLLRLPHPMLIG